MKTKTFIIASLVLLLCPIDQQAQTFTTGITAGVSRTSVSFSNIGNNFTNAIKGKNIMGFEGGLFERINLGPVFIKPMLLVSYQGGTITFYNNDGSVNSSKFNYGRVEVPLLFGVKILELLRIEAGPVYNWIYTKQIEKDNSIKVDPSGLGYRVGANVEFGFLNLGLAYQGLTNKSAGTSAATFKSPNELIFSVALCFGGGGKIK